MGNSKAVHRAYAWKAKARLASLASYEKNFVALRAGWPSWLAKASDTIWIGGTPPIALKPLRKVDF